MKALISGITLVLFCFVNTLAQEASTPQRWGNEAKISMVDKSEIITLKEGSIVDLYPEVSWIQGTPVNKFEHDKIYIIELWATWCIPCIQSMPHLNQLSKKFGDRIIFIGQAVLEPDQSKVNEFVNNDKERMNYRIAFGGMGSSSDFHKKWMKPSGTHTIPKTFVIQNNTIVWATRPSELTEEILQLMVDRKFTKARAMDLINQNR